jgi:membrane fusion protein, multidrug efflux system
MPVEMTEKQDVNREEARRVETRSPGEEVSVQPGTNSSQPIPPPDRRSMWRRRLLMGVLGVLILIVACVFGIPWVREMLNTVSTDDAYVNGHVTFVAPRVSGQISRVLVDDNYRIKKGELLAELDKEPFQIAVSQKRAAVDTAEADLQAAKAEARSIEAEAMSRRWKLQRAVEDLDNQIALLHARVAALDKDKAVLTLAQLDFYRAKQLLGTPAESVSNTIRRKTRCRLPTPKSTRTCLKFTKRVPLWGCRRNPVTARISAKCRPISMRPFLLFSRRGRT